VLREGDRPPRERSRAGAPDGAPLIPSAGTLGQRAARLTVPSGRPAHRRIGLGPALPRRLGTGSVVSRSTRELAACLVSSMSLRRSSSPASRSMSRRSEPRRPRQRLIVERTMTLLQLGDTAVARDPRLAFMPASLRSEWREFPASTARNFSECERAAFLDQDLRRVGAMHRAGVRSARRAPRCSRARSAAGLGSVAGRAVQ
jgi:hypothetical protein